jgi:hypothetical protein
MSKELARFSIRAVMVAILAVLAAGYSTAMAQTATEAPTEVATEAPTEVATEAPTEAAATEEAVADLPDTGQGSTAPGSSTGVMLLLLATGALVTGGLLLFRNKRA